MKKSSGVKRGKLILILSLILFISLMFFIRLSYTGMAVKDSSTDTLSGEDVLIAKGSSKNYEASVVMSVGPGVVNLELPGEDEAKKGGGSIED